MSNLVGKDGRLFAEQKPGADATTFRVDNTSDQYYNSPYYLQHKNQVLPVPKPNIDPPRMNLADVVGDSVTQAIQAAKQISFHSVGDTGATKVGHLADEESVANMMAADVQAGGAARRRFSFTWEMSSIISARPNTTMTSSMIVIECMIGPSLPFPGTMMALCMAIPLPPRLPQV